MGRREESRTGLAVYVTSINVYSEINKSESFSVTRAKTVTKKTARNKQETQTCSLPKCSIKLGTGFFGIPERLGNGIGMIVREREREGRGYYFISIFSIYVDVCSILRPRQARYFTARTCEMGPARTEPAGRNAHKYINK